MLGNDSLSSIKTCLFHFFSCYGSCSTLTSNFKNSIPYCEPTRQNSNVGSKTIAVPPVDSWSRISAKSKNDLFTTQECGYISVMLNNEKWPGLVFGYGGYQHAMIKCAFQGLSPGIFRISSFPIRGRNPSAMIYPEINVNHILFLWHLHLHLHLLWPKTVALLSNNTTERKKTHCYHKDEQEKKNNLLY